MRLLAGNYLISGMIARRFRSLIPNFGNFKSLSLACKRNQWPFEELTNNACLWVVNPSIHRSLNIWDINEHTRWWSDQKDAMLTGMVFQQDDLTMSKSVIVGGRRGCTYQRTSVFDICQCQFCTSISCISLCVCTWYTLVLSYFELMRQF